MTKERMKSLRHISKASVILLLMALSACSDDSQTTTQDVVTEPDLSVRLNSEDENFVSWDDFYSKEDISFNIDSFIQSDTVNGELFIQVFKPDEHYYDYYGSLLQYNKDSSMFIDAYSSSWIIEPGKDGKLTARAGEVDQEVVVINTKKNIRTRMFFCGPSCLVQKAFWYNDEVIGIMGLMSDYSDEYYTPTIWFVNINNGVTIPYQYNENVSIVHANEFPVRYLNSKGIIVRD